MDKLFKQILKNKKKEVKDIRRDFKEEILKAAAFSVGGEFRSIEVDIKSAETFPLFVELKSILFDETGKGRKFVGLEGFEPLSVATQLVKAGLKSGVVIATDRTFLGGDPGWINLVKNNTELAVLQRDFFIDPAQMYQGKAIGADAYLVNPQFAEKERLPGILEAGAEMGLEVFLEVDDLNVAGTLNTEVLTGVVLNLKRNLDGEIIKDFSEKARQMLPVKLIKIARFCPRSKAEVEDIAGMGLQAVILNNEFWQKPDFIDHFRMIHSWCAGISPGKQS